MILMQGQGKDEYREYVMAKGSYAWTTHPGTGTVGMGNDVTGTGTVVPLTIYYERFPLSDAQKQFMNIDKEMWIKGATDNPKDTTFDG